MSVVGGMRREKEQVWREEVQRERERERERQVRNVRCFGGRMESFVPPHLYESTVVCCGVQVDTMSYDTPVVLFCDKVCFKTRVEELTSSSAEKKGGDVAYEDSIRDK